MKTIDDLRPEDVERNIAIIKQIIKERCPPVEVERGPFHDLVIYYSAIFATLNQHNLLELLQAFSIGKLMQAPENASHELADNVMANWMLSRKPGAAAAGVVTFTFDAPTALVIPHNFTLTSGGFKFRTTDAYLIRVSAEGAAMLDTDRVLIKTGEQEWSFSIPVVAVEIGSAGNIRKGTRLRTGGHLSRHLKKVTVTYDFKGGAEEESNHQMCNRLRRAFSARPLPDLAEPDRVTEDDTKKE